MYTGVYKDTLYHVVILYWLFLDWITRKHGALCVDIIIKMLHYIYRDRRLGPHRPALNSPYLCPSSGCSAGLLVIYGFGSMPAPSQMLSEAGPPGEPWDSASSPGTMGEKWPQQEPCQREEQQQQQHQLQQIYASPSMHSGTAPATATPATRTTAAAAATNSS